jgi:hypothetical protein
MLQKFQKAQIILHKDTSNGTKIGHQNPENRDWARGAIAGPKLSTPLNLLVNIVNAFVQQSCFLA